jgi:hypothetical protein
MSEVLRAPEQTVTRMTSLLPPEVMSSCGRDLKLARRRLQQKGDLFDQGGMWKLRWHEDKIGPEARIIACSVAPSGCCSSAITFAVLVLSSPAVPLFLAFTVFGATCRLRPPALGCRF